MKARNTSEFLLKNISKQWKSPDFIRYDKPIEDKENFVKLKKFFIYKVQCWMWLWHCWKDWTCNFVHSSVLERLRSSKFKPRKWRSLWNSRGWWRRSTCSRGLCWAAWCRNRPRSCCRRANLCTWSFHLWTAKPSVLRGRYQIPMSTKKIDLTLNNTLNNKTRIIFIHGYQLNVTGP